MGLFGDIIDNLSEKHERRKYAAQYRKDAIYYVERGKEIINRAYEKASADALKTETAVHEFNNFRRRTADKLQTSVHPLLEEFQSFDINARIKTPELEFSKSSHISDINFSGSFGVSMPSINVSSILDLFDDSDYDEAKFAKMNAKSFYEDMKYRRSLMEEKREKMREIRSFISEQEFVINSLIEKLEAADDKLQDSMKKEVFTQEEADFLTGTAKCAQLIFNLLETEFMTDNYDIETKAKTLLEQLKTIDSNLPAAPEIRKASKINWLHIISF